MRHREWKTIADHLRMPFDATNQVFRQYDGYAGTLIKQADTVLLIYPMEWPMSQTVAANTLDYYAERTDPDGPAMTDAIHAVDSAQIGAAGLRDEYLPRPLDQAVHPRPVRAVRRGPRRQGRIAGSAGRGAGL